MSDVQLKGDEQMIDLNQTEDQEIFGSGNATDEDIAGSEVETSIIERRPEDDAVSEAIRQISRGEVPPAPAPVVPAAPVVAPAANEGEGGEQDRSVAGLMRALMDERDKRQRFEQQVQRYAAQEQERTRGAEQAPLAQRLFEDPDGAIAELREQITAPLTQQMENIRIQHDFALAGVRHAETFPDAWAAWYQKVGSGQDPDTYFRVMKAPSPGEALVSWFKETKQRETVGDDLEAYNERVIREYLEKQGLTPAAPQQEGQAPQPARDQSGRFASPPQAAKRLPTATSRLGQSGNGMAETDEDGSDAAIFSSGRPERK